MEKILEVLSKLLPADQAKEANEAVKEILEAEKARLDAEYNEKLEEAYKEMSAELTAAEKTAEKGYQEAFDMINELRSRLETQRQEFENTLEEEYKVAYDMLLAERAKNETLEKEIYEEYDKKLQEMSEFYVDKVDEYLHLKGSEIYEQAKRDILNDPRMAEHKVTLDKIIDITKDYISDEDYAQATSSKLEEASRSIDELKSQVRILEQRNIRISRENTKLNEQVRKNAEVVTESVAAEKKERAKVAKEVEGKGRIHGGKVEVIAEHAEETKPEPQKESKTLVEGVDNVTLKVLAGLAKAEV